MDEITIIVFSEASGSIHFDTATKTVTMAEASQDNAAIKEKVKPFDFYLEILFLLSS